MITGSLQTRNGKYYSILNLGKYDDGKRNQKRIPLNLEAVPGNKRKAEKAHRDILNDYELKLAVKPKPTSDILFYEYMEQWLEEKKSTIQDTTYESYKATVDKHILPYFKKLSIPLTSVERSHINTYYTEKKKTLNVETVKKHHAIIKPALQKAVDEELLDSNPASYISFKKSTNRFVGKFLSATQGNDLISKAREKSIEPVVILALYLGLRRSEIAGLKWDAIDFENDKLDIFHTVVRHTTTIAKDSTKSESSKRTLPLFPYVKRYLLDLQDKQRREKEMLGSAYFDTSYVCRYANGKPINPQYMSAAFKRIIDKSNLPPVRLHDLRHTCASLLLECGVDITIIREILGHSDISTTMIYVHIHNNAKKDALNKLGNLLSDKKCDQNVTKHEI